MTYSHVASPQALQNLAPGTALYYQGPGGQYVHIPNMGAYQHLAPGTAIYTASQAAATAAPSTPSAADTQSNLSATMIMQSILAPLGLTAELGQWALNLYAQSGDWNYVSSQLPNTPQFQTRFPAWGTWAKEGHTAAQYVDYENTIYQTAHAAGFIPGTINENTITSWIDGNVSAAEGVQRINDTVKAVNGLDKNSEHYLAAQELGVSDGDLASVWFDPKTSLPLLENKLAAAQIGGAAYGAGINLNTTLADQLAKQGVSASQAQSGFNQMANSQQLFAPLPGQAGQPMTQEQQVGGTFGTDAAAQQQIANVQAQRKAVFQAGGSFSSSSTGITGVGAAKGA